MSRYVLAHIELPLELFPDGTHKIHNDRSNIYFETLGRLPPYQTNTQFNIEQILNLATPSPQTPIQKMSLEETTDGDQHIVFRSTTTTSPLDSDADPHHSDDNTEHSDASSEAKSEPDTTEKVLETQYIVHKHEILPRRPKSGRYTFRMRPNGKSSLYSRKVLPL